MIRTTEQQTRKKQERAELQQRRIDEYANALKFKSQGGGTGASSARGGWDTLGLGTTAASNSNRYTL